MDAFYRGTMKKEKSLSPVLLPTSLYLINLEAPNQLQQRRRPVATEHLE
jgi:hypothetical protein